MGNVDKYSDTDMIDKKGNFGDQVIPSIPNIRRAERRRGE